MNDDKIVCTFVCFNAELSFFHCSRNDSDLNFCRIFSSGEATNNLSIQKKLSSAAITIFLEDI